MSEELIESTNVEEREQESEQSEDISPSTGVENAETPAKFELTDEIFASESSKNLKSLVESFVNDHSLPVEEAKKLVEIAKAASVEVENTLRSTIDSAIADYKQSVVEEETKSYNDFLSDPDNFSNVEEAKNVLEFAKNRAKNAIDGSDLDELLKNKSFLKLMKQERDRYSESVFKKSDSLTTSPNIRDDVNRLLYRRC